MGDDFDLFPKRENLDPFSFGKKDKKPKKEGEEPEEDIFGSAPAKPGQPPGGAPPSGPPAGPAKQQAGIPLPLDLGGPEPSLPTGSELMHPLGGETAQPAEEQQGGKGKKGGKKVRKARGAEGRRPSPFVMVGGALLVILLVLYGAMQFMSRKKQAPPASAPVKVAVPAPPAAVPKPVPVPAEPVRPAPAPTVAAAASTPTGQKPAAAIPKAAQEVKPSPAQPKPSVSAPVQAPKPAAPAPAATASTGRFTVQVGALILKSSVKELEGKLRKLGHEPFFKEGTTMARMNLLTVGPFATSAEGQRAVAKLREAGIDADLRQKADGAVVYAGSYLLRENAEQIMQRIRSYGYPVNMSEREVQVPMTFVRVGRYEGMDQATAARGRLKEQGFDAIVVKLQ